MANKRWGGLRVEHLCIVNVVCRAVSGLVPRYVSIMETHHSSQEALAVKNTIAHAMSELGQRLESDPKLGKMFCQVS
jgi:hypothetical protein